jgi:tetratricopeptide (TPR) repeat protein
MATGRPQELVEALEAEARAQEAEERWADLLGTLARLAALSRELGEEGRARAALDQAYQLAAGLPEERGVEAALHLLAEQYRIQGGWDRALELHHRALSLRREAGDRSGVAAALGGIAEVHGARGDFRRALESYQESLAVKGELGDERGLAVGWNNVGAVRGRMGDLAGALEAFEQSLGLQERLGDAAGKAVTLANIGGIHQRQERWAEARAALERSLELQEPAGAAAAATLNTLGNVLRRLGDAESAYRRYAEAKEIMERQGDLLHLTVPAHNLALIHEERGEYREALRLMEEVIAVDKRIGHPDLRADLETFGRIREKLDRERDRR